MPKRILTTAALLALLPGAALAHLTGAGAHDAGHGVEGAAIVALAGLAALAGGGVLAVARARRARRGEDAQ